MTHDPRPFGRLLTAMVTPFAPDGSLDVEGVGTNNTAHTIELAHAAEKAGAHGLLVVTPYYNKPPQEGVARHFRTVADSVGLPVMVYDIPHRAGTAIATETMLRIAEHERIVAVKDAKGDFTASSVVLSRTGLAYYSGDDAATLPLLSIGGVGLVGTSTHFTGVLAKDMIEAFERGDTATALSLHRRALPQFTGIFRVPGTMLVKAGLNAQGRPAGPVRSPLVDATGAELDQLRQDAAAAGIGL
jgi:4-hydroxy-tetrahydrodipicolinate synthase